MCHEQDHKDMTFSSSYFSTDYNDKNNTDFELMMIK